MRKWTHFLIFVAIFSAIPRAAWAQRVLLERPPETDPMLFEAFGRLRAELELQAFEVVVLDNEASGTSANDLEHASQQRGAFAAIALRRGDNGTTAEILIVDRVTGKSTTRKLLVDQSPNGPTLLAVRATDLLRASLVEFAPGERPPEEVVGVESTPPPPEVVRFAQKLPRFEVRVGGIALLTPELGIAAGPRLGARYCPGRRLSLGLEYRGPLNGAEFRTRNGVASVHQNLALFVVSFSVPDLTGDHRWAWGPVLGAGVHHLGATSIVAPPLVEQTDGIWSFAASAALGAQYFFNRTVSVGLDAGALALLPRPVIAVDDARSSPVAVEAQVAFDLAVAF